MQSILLLSGDSKTEFVIGQKRPHTIFECVRRHVQRLYAVSGHMTKDSLDLCQSVEKISEE